jgi:hypothetical protein
MPGTLHSACLVIVTTIITAVFSSGFGAANAAAPTEQAQSTTATSGPSDACSLLTKEDVAAALGEAVSGPESTANLPAGPGMTASSCSYSGSGIHEVTLNLFHLSPDTAAMYRVICAQKGKEGLAGLGDVACWYNDKHGELQVLKGTTFFSVELRRSGDPTEAIKGVARKVFEKLK